MRTWLYLTQEFGLGGGGKLERQFKKFNSEIAMVVLSMQILQDQCCTCTNHHFTKNLKPTFLNYFTPEMIEVLKHRIYTYRLNQY